MTQPIDDKEKELVSIIARSDSNVSNSNINISTNTNIMGPPPTSSVAVRSTVQNDLVPTSTNNNNTIPTQGGNTQRLASNGSVISPTLCSQTTKSIMNVSGTSGAVVNNTPEPGLKRIPTVTFHDPKFSASVSLISNQVPVKPETQDINEVNIVGPGGKLSKLNTTKVTSHENTIDTPLTMLTSPTSILSSSNTSIATTTTSNNNLKDLNKQNINMTNKGTLESVMADAFTADHPHFIVEDSLHTPTAIRSRSNSNSTSPPASIMMIQTNGSQGKLDREASIISRVSEPTPLESVLEEPTNHLSVSTSTTMIKENKPTEPMLQKKNLEQNKNITTTTTTNASAGPQSVAPNIPKRETGKNIEPRLPQDDGKLHILFGACGTLSVFKIKGMIKKLEEIYGRDKVSIQVILTEDATKFFTRKSVKKNCNNNNSNANIMNNNDCNDIASPNDIVRRTGSEASMISRVSSTSGSLPSTPMIPFKSSSSPTAKIEIPPHIQFWTDQDEWDVWRQRTDPVLHIELRRWADILVIAPLTANSLSKISLGLCDNLLTSVIRAWNPNFPIFLAPSMVSSTFNSTMTKKQLNIINEEMPWITVFKPSEKVMDINGDIGLGGMMDGNEIVDKIVMKLGGYPEDEDDNDDDDDDEEEGEVKNITDTEADDDDDEDEDEDDDDDDEDEDEDEAAQQQETNSYLEEDNTVNI
ncbi:uncharacterized protein NDAI_0F00610 [Naumovozyma dairenensis CBS 421]|uniref:Flavoprotein domain-containing protein n=1 Tax=Naumovozyma dairenensis (strain ATCC 10597 / BCRC 20456 / CBS 421 / NBRC 0211 / NRRL Y-12639) TaxID=1071378 RepID=G0WC69_NAUDC|nr:hypothetical protein NDAI_0F00610 [Naumovozyma dairenensis CBS 421]CCD25380.1 hypothetical protein NDAI_0F00610 [Naumovozyma dairenensis CBS 421]